MKTFFLCSKFTLLLTVSILLLDATPAHAEKQSWLDRIRARFQKTTVESPLTQTREATNIKAAERQPFDTTKSFTQKPTTSTKKTAKPDLLTLRDDSKAKKAPAKKVAPAKKKAPSAAARGSGGGGGSTGIQYAKVPNAPKPYSPPSIQSAPKNFTPPKVNYAPQIANNQAVTAPKIQTAPKTYTPPKVSYAPSAQNVQYAPKAFVPPSSQQAPKAFNPPTFQSVPKPYEPPRFQHAPKNFTPPKTQ